MKKKLLLLGLVLSSCFLSHFSNAQKGLISFGTAHSAVTKFDEPTILGEIDNSLFTYVSRKGNIFINKYDKESLKLVYKKHIKLPTIDKAKGSIGYIERLNNKLYVFADYVNKKERYYCVYALEIDLATGMLKTNYKQLVKAESETRKARGSDYLLIVSEDQSKVVLNYYAKHTKQNLYVDKYMLMDHDLNVLVEKEDQEDLSSIDYKTSDYTIDNDGSIYFLKSYQKGTTNIVSFDANKEFEKWEELIDISKSNPNIKGVVNNVKFTISKENNLIVSGFYSDGGDLKGVFYLKIDNLTKETLVSKINLFSQEKIDELHAYIGKRIKNRDTDKTKKLIDDLANVEVLQKTDGGTVLIGELYRYSVTYTRNGGIQSEKYVYDDLLVVNLTKDGDVIWTKGIAKKQYYHYVNAGLVWGTWGVGLLSWRPEIPDYFSYVSGFYDGKLFVLFNDNPKNYKAGNTKLYALKETRKATATAYVFDMNTGESVKTRVFTKKEYRYKIKPQVSYQASENSNLYLYAQKGGKYKLAVIKPAN